MRLLNVKLQASISSALKYRNSSEKGALCMLQDRHDFCEDKERAADDGILCGVT